MNETIFLAAIQGGDFGTSGYLVVFVLGLLFGFVPGIVIGWFIGRSRKRPAATPSIPFSVPVTPPSAQLPVTVLSPAPSPAPAVVPISQQLSRRCPQCNSTFTDPEIGFCLSDGVQLVPVNDSTPHNSQTTLVYGADGSPEILPTVASRPDKG